MAAADLQGETSRAVKQIPNLLSQNGTHFADRGADDENSGLSLLRAGADRLERNLDRLWMLTVKVAESLVDLRHNNCVPLLNCIRSQRHLGVEL